MTTDPGTPPAAQTTPEAPAGRYSAPRLVTRTLSHRKPTRLRWNPEGRERAAIARALDILGVQELRFEGEITPSGRSDFELRGKLKARITQACVISLEPVEAQITEPVERRYMVDFTMPEAEEIEMPEDDSAEGMPELIDIAEVVLEQLSLALPPFPRAPGATLGEVVHAAPGTEALRDADLRPFAGLAKLIGTGQKGGDDSASG